MLKNNSIGKDKLEERSNRLLLLSRNIDDYAAAIGVVGDLLTWAQDAKDVFSETLVESHSAKSHAGIEFGKLYRLAKETAQFYAKIRSLLINNIQRTSGDLNDWLERYNIDGNTPQYYRPLVNRIDAWLLEDARLRALVPPDPRVIPQAFIYDLTARRDQLNEIYLQAYAKKEIARTAVKSFADLMKNDTLKLRAVYDLAVLAWGNNDSRLMALGFVLKSQIWTRNRPFAPEDFRYDPDAGVFIWTAIEDITEYELVCRLEDTSGAWTQLYKGAENTTDAKPQTPGTYDCRLRAWKGDTEGRWTKTIEVAF